ncbi:Ig-like domain-containing protein [Pelagicoccus mobilis]|uniref:Ig-like domain-containing protein n=1 Tax=Pelagicoccus mobilis TaxID=415221 RepID=A0A934RVV1_9BACT|nr:Ig-like domain-containing protein [Pelagicoccus mobilis]MBK1877318.1 Ig-like domain-containing protein [Pelagicoccus mobilis]
MLSPSTRFLIPLLTVFLSLAGQLTRAQYSEIWGVTFTGGEQDAGYLFKMDAAASTLEIKHHFDGLDGGKHPIGTLSEGPDGRIYGVTVQGGLHQKGIIFSYDRAYETFNVEYHLTERIGHTLVLAPNGKFYTTSNAYLGSLYEYEPRSRTLSLLHDFPLSQGKHGLADGQLTLVDEHLLYGTSPVGGNNNQGTLWEYNLSTNTFTVKHYFSLSTGAKPDPYTVLHQNKLYGVATSGGNHGRGLIYEYDLGTDTYTPHESLSSLHTHPESLRLGQDGNLYGNVSIGGSEGGGAIYRFDLSTKTLSFTHEFVDMGNPHLPTGALHPAYSGKLLGITRYGGTGEGLGTVYEYDLESETSTIRQNMDDGFPTDTVLLEVGERAVTSLSLDAPSQVIATDNGNLQLTASLLPVEANHQPVVWTVDNPQIASISQNGLITALANGNVTVTATANFGLGVSQSTAISISNQDDTPPNIPVAAITLSSPANAITSFEQTLQLAAEVTPSNATNPNLSWTSSDESIATVSTDGLLTPISNGTVTIAATATDGSEAIASKTIAVSNYVTSITITPDTAVIDTPRGTIDFDVVVQPENATNKTVEWSVNTYNGATIDSDGVFKAKQNGLVTITAKSTDGSSITDTHMVVLSKQDQYTDVTSVTLSPASGSINTDLGTLQLTPTIAPEDATNKTLTWESANTAVATIDQNGLITATGNGKTFIIARSADSVSRFFPLTVTNQANGPLTLTGLSFEPSTYSISTRDGTINLTPNPIPSDAPIPTLDWLIDKPELVSISSDGLVTALADGVAHALASGNNIYGERISSNVITINVSNQNNPFAAPPPLVKLDSEKLIFSYTRYKPQQGESFHYESSTDLKNWIQLNPETDYHTLSTTNHNNDTQTISLELLSPETESQFIRVAFTPKNSALQATP